MIWKHCLTLFAVLLGVQAEVPLDEAMVILEVLSSEAFHRKRHLEVHIVQILRLTFYVIVFKQVGGNARIIFGLELDELGDGVENHHTKDKNCHDAAAESVHFLLPLDVEPG